MSITFPGKNLPSLLIFLAVNLFYIDAGCAQGYLEAANISDEALPLKTSWPVPASFTANDVKFSGIAPVYLKKDKSQYLLLGLNLEYLNIGDKYFPVADCYDIAPVAGYARQVNERLNLSAILIPLYNSDMFVFRSSDVHGGAVLRGAYKASKNLLIRITAGWRQQFYGPQYILFLGGDWQISKKWRAYGDLPNWANLCYAISGKANAGVNYQSGGYTSFDITQNNHYLLYNYGNLGLFGEYYLTPRLAIRATVAYSVLRNMDIFNVNQKVSGVIDYIPLSAEPTPQNPEVPDGFTFKLSLSARFPELIMNEGKTGSK